MTQTAEERSSTDRVEASAAARRPYEAPQVRRVGSVRELTLGSGGSFPDGIPGKGHRGKG